jgi:hypothetical protein
MFQSVILPEKTHLTAIALGAPMTPQYPDALSPIHRGVRRGVARVDLMSFCTLASRHSSTIAPYH